MREPKNKEMTAGKIITYKEGCFAQIKLVSGERILFSVAQSGIIIFKMKFGGLIPGEKLIELNSQNLDLFIQLFGEPSTDQTPFNFVVEKLASFDSIASLKEFRK